MGSDAFFEGMTRKSTQKGMSHDAAHFGSYYAPHPHKMEAIQENPK